MKKSELVEKLRVFAEDKKMFDSFDMKEQYDYIFSSQIIEFLEQAGMTPPPVGEPVTTEVLDGMSGRVIRVEDSTLFVNRWEAEDGG